MVDSRVHIFIAFSFNCVRNKYLSSLRSYRFFHMRALAPVAEIKLEIDNLGAYGDIYAKKQTM